MAEMHQYKCPNCGGAIEFDIGTQNLKCPYCDTEFNVEDMKAYDESLNKESTENINWQEKSNKYFEDDETDGMAVYSCTSCGGEIIGDENMGATNCPYCGNPVVIMGKFKGALKPDYVIPFKLDKKVAKERLKKHLDGKFLLPKAFKDENHIDEIKGVYVPFWLFDADAEANVNFTGTKVRHWADAKYSYTETSYFAINREGSMCFNNVPVDGSSRMPDDLMESIEPFDFTEAVPFQTAYLAGFLADKYDVDDKDSISRANFRISNSIVDELKNTVRGYASVTVNNTNICMNEGKTKYALYPVWTLSTSWKGNNYLFAMNGQTGKFVGNLPMDKGRFAGLFIGLLAGIGVIGSLISLFVL